MASNTVELVQYATPFLEVSPSQVMCPGQSVWINLYTNVGSIVQWQPPLYGNALTQHISAPGTYTCNVTSCGILTQASVTITLSQPLAQISITGNDSICQGDTVYLNGNPGMTDYEWQPGAIHSSSLMVTQSGTYTLITTNTDNCQATSAPVTIYVAPYSGVVPVVNDTGVCTGGQVTITAQPLTGNYYWYTNPGMTPIFHGNPFVTPAMTNSQTYWVESQTGGPCPPPLVPFMITVFEDPVAQIDIIPNDTLCEGDTAALHGPAGMSSYQWSPSGFTSPSIIVTQSGTYSLAVTDMNGCHADTSVSIFVFNALFSGIYVSDCTACNGWPEPLIAYPTNLNYTWYLTPGSTPLFSGNPFTTPALYSDQLYYLQADNGYCYSNYLPIYVTVTNCEKISSPNVFTPNGDGQNDIFRIEGYDLQRIQCQIFNRWGDLIYEWSNPDGYWDGTIKTSGKPAPPGVYYYIAVIGLTHDSNINLKGFVQLVR
jgi:gliding motility-associated-like protein